MRRKGSPYFLVDGKEIDVGLFHGQQEHEGTTAMANASCAAAAMHKGTVGTQMRPVSPGGHQALGSETPSHCPAGESAAGNK